MQIQGQERGQNWKWGIRVRESEKRKEDEEDEEEGERGGILISLSRTHSAMSEPKRDFLYRL
jgi:hypothetical protein